MSGLFDLLKQNATRCMTLVVAEILVISGFHYLEGSALMDSELIALGLHFVLSMFGLCFYVIMRSKFNLGTTKRYSRKRILGESVLYTIFDFLLIHASIGLLMGEFVLHADELVVILVFIYGINLYFDTHKHHCCHDHCD